MFTNNADCPGNCGQLSGRLWRISKSGKETRTFMTEMKMKETLPTNLLRVRVRERERDGETKRDRERRRNGENEKRESKIVMEK